MTAQTTAAPRVGMLATLRNRRGVIASVDPFDGEPEGRLHLVRVEYTDSDGTPEDTVIWERERAKKLLEPHALPRVSETPPMLPPDFDALVRAARWYDPPTDLFGNPLEADLFGHVLPPKKRGRR